MDNPVVVVALIAACATVIGAIAALVGVLTKTTSDRRTATEVRMDARMDAALAAQDARIAAQDATIAELQVLLKRRLGAVARIFRAIRDQWTGDQHGPNLDPADIAELEDTEVLPPEWIRSRPYRP